MPLRIIVIMMILLSFPASDIIRGEELCDSAAGSTRKPGLLKRILNYFDNSNKEKKTSGMDFSIIGGPYYSSTMGLGIGLVASGLYHSSGSDTLLPPSNASLYGKISTKGFGSVGISGTHISPADSYRITYLTELMMDPSDYWGIGYEKGDNDANESEMKRTGIKAECAFLIHLGSQLYAGPKVAFDYVHAYDIERPDLLEGMRSTTWNIGIGITLSYDSRDVLTNPHRGMYAAVTQSFRPGFIGNKHSFSTTEILFDTYRTLWSGAMLAYDLRSTLNFGSPSWHTMARIGGSYSMRGYYDGRYRDKNMMATQIELRQHVWRRNGIALWAGAATVFRHFSDIRMRRLLPNVGIGYRWEFKKDVNVRLDIGFGKNGQSGFLFNINEAF